MQVHSREMTLTAVTRIGALLWAKCANAKLRHNKALRYPRLYIATVCLFNAKLQIKTDPRRLLFVYSLNLLLKAKKTEEQLVHCLAAARQCVLVDF